jgi:hypothetical protein
MMRLLATAMLTRLFCAMGQAPQLMRHAHLQGDKGVALVDTQKSKKTKLLKGMIKPGACPNFIFGSSYLYNKENDAWFKDIHDEEECAQECDDDRACEQAIYWAHNKTCYIGLGSMDVEPVPEDDVFCYAKHFFNYTWDYHVEDGMCQDFFPGFAIEGDFPLARQCQESDTNTYLAQEAWEHDERCHHWGPEFELSEKGCWGRCLANPHCLTAEYEVFKSDCKLGLLPMTKHNGFKSRCKSGVMNYQHTCKSRCFSKYGLGNVTGWSGHSLQDMWSLLKNVYPAGLRPQTEHAVSSNRSNSSNATSSE